VNRADIQITGPDQPDRLIAIDGSIYLHGATSGHGARGATWVRVPGGKEGALAGLDPLGDPLTTLTGLRSALHGVTTMGTEKLDGVPTTKLAGRLLHFDGADGADATVWIDAQKRIRQLRMVVEDGGATAQITERFSDFGVPVHVTAPPADDVVDLDRLLADQLDKLPQPTPSSLNLPPGYKSPPHPSGVPSPTGSWTVRASGVTEGISWELSTTTATRDGVCLATATIPDLGQISSGHAADGSGFDGTGSPSEYRGHPANCGPAPRSYNNGETDPVVQILDADSVEQAGSGRHYVSGIANAQVTALRARMSDGSTVAVVLRDGVFFATWAGDRRIASMTFDYPPEPYVTCVGDTGDGYDVGDLTCG
jgi:hypothetical protein